MAGVVEGSQRHLCSHAMLGDNQVQAPLVNPNYPLTSQERGFQSTDGVFSFEDLLILALTKNTQCYPVPNNLEANKHLGVGKHLIHIAYCIIPQSLGKLLLISAHD